MGDPARKLSTFEELLAEIDRLPEYLSGEIIEPGVIRTMSRPLAPHRRAAGQCYRALGDIDEAAGGVGWWIELEPAVRFGDRLFNPDIAGWRVERSPNPPDGYPITLLPDWCCEILSPSTARDDRLVKLPHYARFGVPWIWIIDPALRSIEVYQTVERKPVLEDVARDDAEERFPPFDIDISFARFWLPSKYDDPSFS